MTLHSDIWRLPGPGGFVRELARLAEGGQHVLAVVPRFIADDPSYSDALAVAIQNALEDPRRLYPAASQGGFVSALGFNMTDEFDGAPATIPELITHADVAGRVFVCNAADLDSPHLAELSTFLQRLDGESRSVPRSERATMIFILGRDILPEDPASVATTRVWYWDRVARWDTAALLAQHSAPGDLAGVLGEIRLETIIEVSRWDFELAIEIAHDWSGNDLEIGEIISRRPPSAPFDKTIRLIAQKRPPELRAHVEAWDGGVLESWHGIPTTAPASSLDRQNGLIGLFWSAQSRVLLPWLEIQRARLERLVREKLGPVKMTAAVEHYSTKYADIDFDPSLVELATLARIVNARFGSSEEKLSTTTRLLRSTRNRLAHFQPLRRDELLELVQTCGWLD
jgi:hypothetical protein